MISGLGSSISLAMRTAERANKTMDKMATQIATGKKVANVKDDGASYVISTSLKSRASELETKSSMIDQAIGMNQMPILSGAHAAEMAASLRDIVLSAIANASSANSRTQLANEFLNQLQTAEVGQQNFINNMSTDGVFWSNDQSDSFGTWFLPFANQSDMADLRLRRGAWLFYTSYSGYAADIQAGNVANLTALVTTLNNSIDSYSKASMVAASENWQMENRKEFFNNASDSLRNSAENLTDADMGKVSKEYEMAQTRQSLAYQTVRNAIAAYSNKATSLLNNVMSTQRNVSA